MEALRQLLMTQCEHIQDCAMFYNSGDDSCLNDFIYRAEEIIKIAEAMKMLSRAEELANA